MILTEPTAQGHWPASLHDLGEGATPPSVLEWERTSGQGGALSAYLTSSKRQNGMISETPSQAHFPCRFLLMPIQEGSPRLRSTPGRKRPARRTLSTQTVQRANH